MSGTRGTEGGAGPGEGAGPGVEPGDLSPNRGPRRGGARPDMVVLHFTAMESAAAARDRLCDPAAEVSSHYLIGGDGRLWRLVPEAERAWHAGRGAWGGVGDVNSRSIGIELDNTGRTPFSEPQMRALEALLDGITERWGIPPERVIGHSDMAPDRKSDPGRRFDWLRLARGGRAVWPDPAPAGPGDTDPATRRARFTAAAVRFGYDPDGPGGLPVLLDAFRQRFRPAAPARPSVPDARDVAMIEDLARRWPVSGAPGG